MVRKLRSAAEAAGAKKAAGRHGAGLGALQGSALAAAVKESAQQIWLAGMGAFGKAQAEGGKVFEALVKEGVNLQKKTQGLAEERINEMTGRMSAMADSVSAKAGQNWDKLEAIFEQRTAKAMNKLGVPTAKDVEALAKRVDALASAVAKLARRAPAAPHAAAKTPAAAAQPESADAAQPAKPAKRAPRRKAV
ncbi:MAG: hypothetical protein AMXMBFR66_19790 [Pseudomonadota bacterium]|nr:phasin family protein [Rubrivivax sp.]